VRCRRSPCEQALKPELAIRFIGLSQYRFDEEHVPAPHVSEAGVRRGEVNEPLQQLNDGQPAATSRRRHTEPSEAERTELRQLAEQQPPFRLALDCSPAHTLEECLERLI
jgi:hypothetical protein